MSNEKQYVGGAKEMSGNYGVFHKISFSAQDLETMKANLNAKGYVNLAMNQRQQPSPYGQTHSLVIDTWQPPAQNQQPQQFQQPVAPQTHVPIQQHQGHYPPPVPPNQYDNAGVQQPPFQQGAPIPQQFQNPQ